MSLWGGAAGTGGAPTSIPADADPAEIDLGGRPDRASPGRFLTWGLGSQPHWYLGSANSPRGSLAPNLKEYKLSLSTLQK